MIAFYIGLGIVIGIIALFLFASWMAKSDNKKFDPEKPEAKQEFTPRGFWPETDGEAWKQSTTTVEIHFADKGGKKNTKKKKNEASLEDQLKAALDVENYEEAAKIRDLITKQTKSKK